MAGFLRQRLQSELGDLAASALSCRYAKGMHSRIQRLGTLYGGWHCSTTGLTRGKYAVCVGAGEDITFDIALIEQFSMNVICVDPTPRSIQHVKGLLKAAERGTMYQTGGGRRQAYRLHRFDATRFKFVPVAIWSKDGVVSFFAPENPSHVSYSVTNIQRTADFIEVPSLRLSSLVSMLGVSSIELLKLDIEGAECEVLEDMIASDLRPRQLLVEFDSLYSMSFDSVRRVFRCVASLRQAGYQLAFRERANFTFQFALVQDKQRRLYN